MNRIIIESELLLGLYYGNGYSIERIAKELKTYCSDIRRNMISYMIPRRTIAEAMTNNDFEIELLEQLYLGNCYTKKEISKLLGVSYGTIRRKYKNYNISERKRIFTSIHKRRIGTSVFGENNGSWKDGLYKERQTERHKLKNKESVWRLDVYKRDNHTCQICYEKGCILNAHHIKSWVKYPDLRFDVSNGITLCRSCHQKVHHKGVRIDI